MDNNEILFEQMKNLAFVDALNQAKSLEAAVQLMNGMGISVSAEALQRIQKAEENDGFLSEEALEYVSGGAPEVGLVQLLMPKIFLTKK